MAIREVLTSFTFEQQRQMINLIGTDIGDTQFLITPSKVLTNSVNQIVAGFVTLSGQTVQLEDGTSISPSLSFDSQINLGLYKSGTDTIGITKNLFVGGNLTVDGDITFRAGNGTGGTINFGDLDTDNIVFNADLNSNIIPNVNNTFDIGSNSKQWKDIFIDGIAQIDTLQIDENATITGSLFSNSGTISVTSGVTTVDFFDDYASTIEAFGAGTNIRIGANTGTLTLRNPTIVGVNTTQNLFNTTVTTVNAFGAASEIFMGVALGNVPGNNSNFTIRSDDTILVGDLNVNGGEILSSENTFDLLINNGDIRIGSASGTGTTIINNSLKVKGGTLDLTNQGVTISVKDNINPALKISEGANDYLSIQTSDSLEKIIFHKNVNFTDDISVTGNITASGLTISGDLIVNGTTTTINSTNLSIDDLNIILADGASTSSTVDGAGITLGTTGITFTYSNTGTYWTSTENLNIANAKTYQINGTTVLSSTQVLGKGFTNVAGEIVTTDGTQTLSNKTLTTPTISSILNTGTLTLPTSTDTLVGRATSDTLTNKTYGNSSSTSDADATVDSATTSYYAYVQSASTTTRTINISNLAAGRVIQIYLRNTNAGTKSINITSSTTTTGFAAVNLSKGDAGGTSQTSVTLAATSGTAVVTVFNANGTIGGSIS